MPVPAEVPKGKGDKASGDDKNFNTGDRKNGWKSLNFAMISEIQCRYTPRAQQSQSR